MAAFNTKTQLTGSVVVTLPTPTNIPSIIVSKSPVAQSKNHLQPLRRKAVWEGDFWEVTGNFLSIHSLAEDTGSINQPLAESITIVPLNAPNIVDDKLRPVLFCRGVVVHPHRAGRG